MAGLYVHIPFCKSRCIYCDFYSTTREAEQEAYVGALCREIRERRHELPAEADGRVCARTIYIGGGTPSLLSPAQLARIFGCIRENYAVADGAEVTVEMNPEDVVVDEALSLAGGLANGTFNRVSLGIQTFDDDLLRLLRRRHSAGRAVEAVKNLQLVGAQNISIDLIYGLPGQTLELWERDLDVAFSLGVQHLSAYALSYEEGTPLWRMRQRGEVQEAADELSVRMYERLCQRAREAGFEHYEISNFALPGYHSRHNSSYWTGEAYLGFGPGAHSFDGRRTRRSNHSSLSNYLSASRGGEVPHDVEVLTDEELYEEAVMCGLRTCRGVDLAEIGRRYGRQRLDYLLQQASSHLRGGRLAIEHEHLRLTEAALMISDDVMSDLMA
ncbi:MAG: radical SAM family heme chaperone HemW [Bacteroidaceae bacterium]|nr:radical SAM family heme chaperone HemW [Bacteroidaceae bacterium]